MIPEKKAFVVVVEPEGRELTANPGTILAESLRMNGYPIVLPCGGNGSCGKCVVKYRTGAPVPVYEETLFMSGKQIADGLRLACLTRINADARVSIDDIREPTGEHILTSGKSRPIKADPAVFKKLIELSPSSLANPCTDEQRILADGRYPIQNIRVLRQLPETVRNGQDQITLTFYQGQIIAVESSDTRKKLYGIALDLGTTTIVFSIIDLNHGKTEYLHAGPNPQRKFGDDLISRLAYLGKGKKHLDTMNESVIDFLNHMIHEGCREIHILPDHIMMLTLSANTVMNHLFLGVDPRHIGQAPYTPVFAHARSFSAEQIGLDINPQAPVFISPNIGGFVGGDIVSDMLVAGFGKRRKHVQLLIDIGTNCEVVLEKDGQIWAASSPAGPALEGACISSGMRAAPGAILDADLARDDLNLLTIDHQTPRGICGSGLFHLVDLFYRMEFIDTNGRIRKRQDITDPVLRKIAEKRITEAENHYRAITVHHHIQLNQNDIREFQLAKAAIAAAWQLLCEKAGCLPANIGSVYIAGAFGNYIRPKAAVDLGMIPSIDLKKIHFIGNASLEGARMMLINRKYQKKADRLARMVNFVELAGRPEFQEKYVENMRLGQLRP